MKNHMLLVVTLAALVLAGCAKSASVEGDGTGKLTLVKPAAVTVHRGGLSKSEIKIDRKDLAGDVTIQFTKLPRGVDIVENDNKIVGDQGTYTLRASDAADLVENSVADVTASAGPGKISVTQQISISVKPKD
jgi:ABC-type glycerol-3-phosphate transport system substrate-binding protein